MKTFSFLLLSSLLLSSLARDCNNPLLNTFGLTGLDQPAPGTGLPFCADLANAQTCCSAETVSQFQALINNLTQTLLDISAQRDQNIANLRTNLLNNYDQAVDNLSDFDDDITNLQNTEPEVGNEIRSELNLFEDVSNRLDNIDDNGEFANAIADYQRRRVTCFNTLLQVQASAWCLACNPNYAGLGVSEDGSITFSSDLNNNIVSNCLPFTESGQNFNALFQANQSFARVQNLITYLQNYTAGGNVLPNYNVSDDIEVSSDSTQRTNTVPEGCSGNTCAFQNENLFVGGALNQSLAANGAGVIGGGDIALPDVGQAVAPPVNNGAGAAINNDTNETAPTNATNVTVVDNTTNVVDNATRLLQQVASAWNPDLSQSGVQINVVADPGQVSGLQGDGSNQGNQNSDTDDSDNVNGGLSSVRLVASGLTITVMILGALMI